MRQRKGTDLRFSITINSVFSFIATALYLLRPNNMMTTTHLLLLRTKTCLKLFQVKECRAQVKDSVASMTGGRRKDLLSPWNCWWSHLSYLVQASYGTRFSLDHQVSKVFLWVRLPFKAYFCSSPQQWKTLHGLMQKVE